MMEESKFQHQALSIVVKRDKTVYPRRIVTAVTDRGFYHSESVAWNVWEGHAGGSLWMQEFLDRATKAFEQWQHGLPVTQESKNRMDRTPEQFLSQQDGLTP
jgi:hypothetical protein